MSLLNRIQTYFISVKPSKITALNKKHLSKIILEHNIKYGSYDNFNYIDISQITDLSHFFFLKSFNGNISEWNTSNVTNMDSLFHRSSFLGDISNWDTSNVTSMSYMFSDCPFNGELNNWNVSNVKDMAFMFKNSLFDKDISNWKIKDDCDLCNIFTNATYPKQGFFYWYYAITSYYDAPKAETVHLQYIERMRLIVEGLKLTDIQAAKYLYDSYLNQQEVLTSGTSLF